MLFAGSLVCSSELLLSFLSVSSSFCCGCVLTQVPNSSSSCQNVESVSVDPLVPVRVPAPLGVLKYLASLRFCNLAGLAKAKQAGSVYGQE